MTEQLNPESLDQSPNIIEVCENAFANAYYKELNSRHKFVKITDNIELISLHKPLEDFDIRLCRQHIEYGSDDIAFWISPNFVVLNGDISQLYIQETPDAAPVACDPMLSNEIVQYIDTATPESVV